MKDDQRYLRERNTVKDGGSKGKPYWFLGGGRDRGETETFGAEEHVHGADTQNENPLKEDFWVARTDFEHAINLSIRRNRLSTYFWDAKGRTPNSMKGDRC